MFNTYGAAAGAEVASAAETRVHCMCTKKPKRARGRRHGTNCCPATVQRLSPDHPGTAGVTIQGSLPKHWDRLPWAHAHGLCSGSSRQPFPAVCCCISGCRKTRRASSQGQQRPGGGRVAQRLGVALTLQLGIWLVFSEGKFFTV